MNELALYSFDAQPLDIQRKRGDYEISVYGGTPAVLKRDTDFGMIRKPNGDALTKHPTLFKSGAEKVAVAYGLCQRYNIESKIEDIADGFFFYAVRCDLVKIVNDKEYVITSAYGSGNTREGRAGKQSPYDGANSALKMAQKRALVSAALSLGCMSNEFTQDIEGDEEAVKALYPTDDNAFITSAQVTYFYTICTRNGISKNQAKKMLEGNGYKSAKEIKGKDFDRLCETLLTLGGNE